MYRIAVMGDRDSIYGFAAVGLDIFPVESTKEALSKLKHMADSGYAIVYVTEGIFTALAEELGPFLERQIPALIPIPGLYGNTGIGIQNVSRSVERAVGSDILSQEEGAQN